MQTSLITCQFNAARRLASSFFSSVVIEREISNSIAQNCVQLGDINTLFFQFVDYIPANQLTVCHSEAKWLVPEVSSSFFFNTRANNLPR